ncbi:uncharacterized protein (DUF2141 family) [Sphingomonas jejuensis]|jgi:uncharacterized protein (DUF2141 family)|uniref:Uncharacterized protein (DUF2141 family) n=1 Tax=Sphingomonas jejuensis TaxID=904715 RepID=A0ABX0XIE7_9SPHN|nr:DUF2141 domain-containing protein [Sphingomonas jejuensis]NJC32619.1 uncharacterized protein (DUF2141 family) [Sphingomonas jejuensis]
MRAILPLLLVAVPLSATAAPVPPREERGRADADCRPGETGPGYRISVRGLKDRTGLMRLELYPASQEDFLAPDRVLIAADKPFRRVVTAMPTSGPVTLCIRAPGPGTWALAVHHDRDRDGRFGFLRDGVGFPNNPRIGRAKPDVRAVALPVGRGLAETVVIMNYRRGLGFGPIG